MTLETLYYISQIIVVALILASLAAVYLQVRQTNEIAKASLTQSTWLQMGAMQMSLFDTPEKAELMHRALRATGPLSESEKMRIEAALGIIYGLNEAAHNLHKRSLIEDSAFNSSVANLRRFLASPFVQAFWKYYRAYGKDPAYVALIDGIIAEINAKRQAKQPASEHPLQS